MVKNRVQSITLRCIFLTVIAIAFMCCPVEARAADDTETTRVIDMQAESTSDDSLDKGLPQPCKDVTTSDGTSDAASAGDSESVPVPDAANDSKDPNHTNDLNGTEGAVEASDVSDGAVEAPAPLDAGNAAEKSDEKSTGEDVQTQLDANAQEGSSKQGEEAIFESGEAAKTAADNSKNNAMTLSAVATSKAAPVTAKAASKKTSVSKALTAGWYSISTVLKSSYRMQVRNSGSKTGTKLIIKKKSASTGQAFKLVKKGAYWRLMSGVGFKSRVTMDANGNVYLSTSGGRDALFKLVANKDGSYRLINVGYKKALAIKGGLASSGAYLTGAKSNAKNKAQAFKLISKAGILDEGLYSMRTWLNAKYAVAPKGGSLSVGANTALVKYGAGMTEKWQVRVVSGMPNVYTLENIATGYRLTSASGSASVAIAANNKNQWWRVVGANGQVMLKNLATKQVLQVNGDKAKKNATVMSAKSTKADNQRFTMKSASTMESGFYELVNGANGLLALEVKNGSNGDNANVQVGVGVNSPAQRWYYDKSSRTLSNANSGMLLTAKSGKIASGVSVVQSRLNGSVAQKWVFQYIGGGKFRIVSNANKAIAVSASGTKSGSNAKLANVSTTMRQRWNIRVDKPTINTAKQLRMTLDQMIKWQRAGNPYISDYTTAQLKKVLDPANCNKYQFLDLRKSAGATAAQLDAFINTYGSKGKLKGLGAAFVSAGKTYKVNEVYLLAHAILESGWGSSTLANGYKYSGGTIDGKKYKAGTYYNFYGIGAYDSSPLSGGRKLAIINGWNTPSKAVTGAAKWIANNYVYASSYPQYTLYNMKWDTDRSNATQAYGWHQYATSPDWAQSIASLMESCFKLVKTTGSLSYIKPVYK